MWNIWLCELTASSLKKERKSEPNLKELSSLPEVDSLRGWLTLAEQVELLCNLYNGGRNLRHLVKQGSFSSNINAASSLMHFGLNSWKEIISTSPIFNPLTLSHPRLLNPRVPQLLNEYIRLNRDLCGFRHLPVFFQREYHSYFLSDPEFPVILDDVNSPADALAFFPAAGNVLQLAPATATFGVMHSSTTLRIYDIERACSAILTVPDFHFLPDRKVVARIVGETALVWWPLSGNFSIPIPNIQDLELSTSDDPGIFYVSVWDDSPQLTVFICRLDQPGNFSKIPYSVTRLDGDVADIQTPNEDRRIQLLLFPGAKRSGYFPNLRPNLLELHGRYLVNTFRLIGFDYFREHCAFYDTRLEIAENSLVEDATRRALISICQLLQGPLPHEEHWFSEETAEETETEEETAEETAETLTYLRDLIESVMWGEPDSFWSIENIFKKASGFPIHSILLN